MKHDFIELEQALWAATVRDVDEPRPEHPWSTDFVVAIERALVVGDFTQLFELLDGGEVVHPLLGPALADAIRARGRNKRSGRKSTLVSTEAIAVARAMQRYRQRGMSKSAAAARTAADYGLTSRVVERGYEVYVPNYLRPKQRPPGRRKP